MAGGLPETPLGALGMARLSRELPSNEGALRPFIRVTRTGAQLGQRLTGVAAARKETCPCGAAGRLVYCIRPTGPGFGKRSGDNIDFPGALRLRGQLDKTVGQLGCPPAARKGARKPLGGVRVPIDHHRLLAQAQRLVLPAGALESRRCQAQHFRLAQSLRGVPPSEVARFFDASVMQQGLQTGPPVP